MASRVEPTRDLLLALYALQSGALGQAQLLSALNEWAGGNGRTMSGILSALGVLSASELAQLQARVQQDLGAPTAAPTRSGGPPRPAPSSRPGGSEPTRTFAPATWFPDHMAGRHTEAAPDLEAITGRRFHVLGPHARGGLGEVFLALDRELDRAVALKELQGHLAHDPDCQARFLREAQVTGRLEHPGIVPVYSLGRHPDGRPFYAMRLIQGETYREAIERFHHPGPPVPGADDRALAFQRLLRSLVETCNAVAYAHSRGVVHRDLKPENIMLGPFGETLVVDWGVAKAQDLPEAGEGRPLSSLESSASAAVTQPGSVIGTPRYMSPEQAAGDLERVGPASDIYSLGAILYHLLVGHPPFLDGDVRSVLNRVRLGIFPAPRQVRRSIDPTLEAICLKAMALEPGNRQATALELANELEAWQADVRYRTEQELALSQVKGSLTRLCLERAHTCFDRDAHDEAMLWLARALENAPRDPAELERVIRTSLFAWYAGGKLLERTLRHRGEVHAIAFCPDGRSFLTAGAEGMARLWDLSTGSPLSARMRHGSPIRAVAFHPAGTFLVTAGDDGRLQCWDAVTGEALGAELLCGGPVDTLAFNADGSRIAAGCGMQGFCLWSAAGLRIDQAAERDARVSALAFSPNGAILAVAEENGRVRLLEASSGKALGDLARGSSVTAVEFGPEGERLLMACAEGQACLWNVRDGRMLVNVSHESEIRCVGFRPDGRAFATGCVDGSARLWDAATGRPIGESLIHRAGVECLAFRPGGTMVATGSLDGTVQIWCAGTGLPMGPPLAHGSPVRRLLFSPDGRRMATCGSDTLVRCWKVPDPIEGEAERVSCWIRVTTGLAFDEGNAVGRIDGPMSWDLRRRLTDLGGPPLK